MKVEVSQYTRQNHLHFLTSKRHHEGIICKRKKKRIPCEAVDTKRCSWGLLWRDFYMYIKDRTRIAH